MLVFILGCNYQAQLEKDWLGQYRTTLIAMKGTPDDVIGDGFGGQIFTYRTYHSYSDVYVGYGYPHFGYGYGYGYGLHHHHHRHYSYYDDYPVRESSKTMFWIDPFDKVYKVSVSY